nr:suppressor of fused domain protein [Arthrobacter sp. ISL-85]
MGTFAEGWSKDADGHPQPAQVVKFIDGPLDGVTSYSTLGLSRRPLDLPGKAPVRVEFLMMVRSGHFERYVPSIMQQLVGEVIHRGQAPLRGEVIGPWGPLDPDTRLEAFYFGIPVYQPEEFATYEDADGPIIISWLVPLFPTEAAFVGSHGWSALEDLLIQHDPDLTDWRRLPLPVDSP